jgi:hypothetical protein
MEYTILRKFARAAVISSFSAVLARADDPLASWGGTALKQAIIKFVERVIKEDSPDFVRPEERIATFDNDGPLWTEQPIYFQFQFGFDRVKALARTMKGALFSTRGTI